MMKRVPLGLVSSVVIGLGLLAPLRGDAATSEGGRGPPIREFTPEIIAQLGRDIYRHDQLAWIATDVLLAKVSQQKMARSGAVGWVVDTASSSAPVVRFLRNKNGRTEAAYDVTFPPGGKPALSVPAVPELTEAQRANATALATVRAEFASGAYPWCGGRANTVVLPDPDGRGFLVYFLRAKQKSDEVPVGGHYRVTVSADGRKVEQVDRLSASCLTMRKEENAQRTVAALTMTHFISKTPVETHVFLSLQEKIPFFVVTEDKSVWTISNGQMERKGTLDELQAVAGQTPQ